MRDKKVLLVGCGKMGDAILGGIIESGVLTRNIIVIEPHSESISHDIKTLKNFEQKILVDLVPDVIIFAVKPQTVESILPDYKQFANALFISIIAGKTIAFFEKHLGKTAAIIRTMPNLPVLIGKGTTVFYKNKNVTDRLSDNATALFGSIGDINYVTDENLLDAVTAISGSGPAYVFHFIECLAEAAIELGIPAALADKLVYKTIEGSIALAISEYGSNSATNLRQAVTSRAGTTEAALKVLMQNDTMQKLIAEATTAACKRSKELSE